jgi:acetyltransferase-like isoleucine patch superfamily enzyme
LEVPLPIVRKPARKRGPVRRAALAVRNLGIAAQLWVYRSWFGMTIGKDVKLSLRANLDLTNPRGIHIGDRTYLAFGAVVFTHDMVRLLHTDTYIGSDCFIGANAIIMAGVRIGDHCIVGSGAVVTKDVPSGCIVGGNPARILREGVRTGKWGILSDEYEYVIALEAAAANAPR